MNKSSQWAPWALLFVIVMGAGWLRYNLIDVPLERDEGEYAYGGQLLLQGIPPYAMLYNMKLPGIYAAYAAVMVLFGQTHTGVHLGLLVVNALTTIMVFLLTREIAGTVAALGAALFFGLVSIGQPVQGIFANSEHFVLPPALLGIFLLLKSRKGGPCLLFCAGLSLGAAFLVKQHGVAFIAFGGCFLVVDYLLGRPYGWASFLKRLGAFLAGVFVPYFMTCFLLAQAGVFDKFWFWTVDYAGAYTSQVSFNSALFNLKNRSGRIFSVAPLLWSMALLGIPFLFMHERTRNNRIFALGLIVFSFLAICPGLYFRPHYFILLLPASAMLAGITVSFAAWSDLIPKGAWRPGFTGLLILLAIGLAIHKQRDFLFEKDSDIIIRSTYWPNPFTESLQIAQFIAANTTEADKIAIIGSEPQIYFYANRKSASGYIYMYPLMENHNFAVQMQKELIQEVEQASPKYMVFVRVDLSWLQKLESPTLIYDWFTEYKENYDRVGMVEIFNRASLYSWRPNVKWPPSSQYWIEILERKAGLSGGGG